MTNMDFKREDIELLAPVGSYESLMASIQGHANAIYFGVENLNMRSRSSANFTLEDLEKIAEICKENHIKTYLALNIVIYDEDIEEAKNIVKAAKKAGIDAIIASDMAVVQIAYENKIAVHASTQLNISNTLAISFFSKFCDTIVLARELNIEQVKNITDFIRENEVKGPSGELVKIEVFAHGALCMAVSGKCFLSEHLDKKSANRGACYQICRRSFTVFDDRGQELKLDNNYILSPKDLNTLPILDKIIASGVRILKIEGRGRSPEYVKNVCETYHNALVSIEKDDFDTSFIEESNKSLKQVFNRGFYEGHYLGKHTSDWNSSVYGNESTRKKIYIGKGRKYYKNISVGEFILESKSLEVGDEILITGPTTGVIETKVKELRLDEKPVESVKKGDIFSMPINEIVRPSDKLYKYIKTEG
jgi:putative protease